MRHIKYYWNKYILRKPEPTFGEIVGKTLRDPAVRSRMERVLAQNNRLLESLTPPVVAPTKNVLVIGTPTTPLHLEEIRLLEAMGYNIIREPFTMPRELIGMHFDYVFVQERSTYASP